MSKICTLDLIRTVSVSVYIVLILVSFDTVNAQHEDWRGNAFTDPEKVYSMPSDWINQPIVYNSSASGADITITLDQHLYPHLSPVIQEYAQKHNLKIIISQGTCGITSGKLSKKEVDIGGLCCAPGDTDRLPGLRFHTLGIAALLLIVHPDNPVRNITFDEAQKIFMGEIGNWSEIKIDESGRGNNSQIQPISRLHCKLRPGHWHLLLDNEDLFSPIIQDVGAIPDMIYSVSSNPKAIGYETMTAIDRYFKDADAIGVSPLRINGFAHNESSRLLSLDYPLYRVFNLTTWEGDTVSNPHAQELVEYLISAVERLDSRLGIVTASELRKAGWEFHGNELSGEPR